MYLSGISIKYFAEILGIYASARLPAIILNSLTIVTLFLFSRKIFNNYIGLIAGFFLIFSPYHLTYSRAIILDGILGFFFILTIYFYYLSTITKKKKFLLLTGISLCLSCLTKMPGFLLFPIIGLLEFINKNNFKKKIKNLLIIGFVFIFCSLLIWPILWSKPLILFDSYINIGEEKEKIFSSPHTRFYNGEFHQGLPFNYYSTYLLYKLTPIILSLFILSILYLSYKKKIFNKKFQFITIPLLLYFIPLSFLPKKAHNYMDPIIPFIILIASYGFYKLFKHINIKKNLKISLIILIVLFQALHVISYHPNYYFYYNPIIHNIKNADNVFGIGQSQGLEESILYIKNENPNSIIDIRGIPSSHYRNITSHYTGLNNMISKDHNDNLKADYIIFYKNTIYNYSNWKTKYYDDYSNTSPTKKIIINKIHLVDIYKVKNEKN
jgi:4-amino-4-deoxy-L-arabinose transferase-like glycosyltransferase